MSFLYQLGIAFYSLMISIAALFNRKAAEWVRGRKNWKSDLSKAFTNEDKVAWFHAASLGEFEQGRPVIEALRKEHSEYKILLTFFSPSGYLQKKNYEGVDKVMYLPADCKRNAKVFVKTLNPKMAVFIKYEFWYNYLTELKKNDVPVFFISALFRTGQPFFKWYGGWFRKKLAGVEHFFVQDKYSAEKLESIGFYNVSVSGDTRFDRVADILSGGKENPGVEAFCKDQRVLLVGSSWPQDEEILATLPHAFPELKIIIAPHEVNEERIKELTATFKVETSRYTKDSPASWLGKQVLIIDTIGVLSGIYRYATIAYIGGAFSTGLHNIQEPAVNGMPVIFGPQYHKFREAIDLVDLGGAFSVGNANELHSALSSLLNNKDKYLSACNISKQYMLDNTGATRKIMDGLESYF